MAVLGRRLHHVEVEDLPDADVTAIGCPVEAGVVAGIHIVNRSVIARARDHVPAIDLQWDLAIPKATNGPDAWWARTYGADADDDGSGTA
jgi:hypothetical protein